MSKSVLIQAIKLLLAFAVVFYFLKSGRLSFDFLNVFAAKPFFFVISLLLMTCFFCINFYRWKLILSMSGIQVTFLNSLRLSMLGQFFSTFIPGAVGGDLIKALYVARRYPSRKAQSVLTVLVDRLVGLFALVLLGGLGFLFGREQFYTSAHKLKSMAIVSGWGLVVCATVGFLLFSWVTLYPKGIPKTLPSFFSKKTYFKRLESLYELILSFQKFPLKAWFAFFIAIVVQALNLCVLLLIAYALFGAPPWSLVHVDSFIAASCVGLCLMALPLAPLGVGVGQVAFATMFTILGIQEVSFGASIVTAYQFLSLILNLFGLYFYVSYRHEVEL